MADADAAAQPIIMPCRNGEQPHLQSQPGAPSLAQPISDTFPLTFQALFVVITIAPFCNGHLSLCWISFARAFICSGLHRE